MKQAYKVCLENFEGPLDLLLFLIKQNEIDIYDIPISKILDQYIEYLALMESLDLEIAGEFLVMAATLMYIKSKMLLPKPPVEEDDIEDPRTELVNQLLEYQKIKQAADFLEKLETSQKLVYPKGAKKITINADIVENLDVNLFDLVKAFKIVLDRKPKEIIREIIKEEVKVEDKIADIIELLKEKNEIKFEDVFCGSATKLEVIVTFLAVLELIRIGEIKVYQNEGIFLIAHR